MKKFVLIKFTIFVFALNSQATELFYQWKNGASYHFSSKMVDHVNTSMMGMNMKDVFKTQTDFVLHIQSVDAKGTADAILYLVNFKVTNSGGNTIASLNDIPKNAVKSDVRVDKKGKFTFLKKVFMITSGSSNVLAYGNASENSVSAGGQAGNIKVDAYAEFNPKTGTLKTGYSVQEINNTQKVSVKMTEETDKIDVLPYDFLELLALPDGNVNKNDEFNVQSGIYKTGVLVTDIDQTFASLNYTMNTDKSAELYEGKASGKSGDGNFNMDMDMNNMDMDMDMDMDNNLGGTDDMFLEDDKNAMEMSKSMSPDMTCDITSTFNHQKGMFEKVAGTVHTNINTMGMKMTVDSQLEMILVK